MFDTDAFFDAVVAGDLGRAVVGPARTHWATWNRMRQELLDAHPKRSGAEGRAVRLACRQGFVLSHDQARRCGMTRARLRQLVRARTWTAPRRGVLCPLPPGDGSDRPAGDSIEMRSTAAALVRPDMVISHDGAAALHGLPLLRSPLRVSLTATWRPAACNWQDVVVRVAALPHEDVERWFGAPVTTVARTVVDVARHSARSGIMAADDALREDVLSGRELDAAVRRQRGWPGVVAARLVAALADPRPESPLESLARLFLHRQGFPLPEPQVWVTGISGRRYRVDGLWLARGVVLEVDGMGKYVPGALAAERKRQEDLERAGYRVIRIDWDDIRRFPEQTVRGVARALRLGGHPSLCA